MDNSEQLPMTILDPLVGYYVKHKERPELGRGIVEEIYERQADDARMHVVQWANGEQTAHTGEEIEVLPIDPNWSKRLGLEKASIDPFPPKTNLQDLPPGVYIPLPSEGGFPRGKLIMWGNKEPLPPGGAKSRVEAYMNAQIINHEEAKQDMYYRSLSGQVYEASETAFTRLEDCGTPDRPDHPLDGLLMPPEIFNKKEDNNE